MPWTIKHNKYILDKELYIEDRNTKHRGLSDWTVGAEPGGSPVVVRWLSGDIRLFEFGSLLGGIITAHERVKSIIENTGDMSHFFIPCEIYDISGSLYSKEYFIFKPGMALVESIDEANSEVNVEVIHNMKFYRPVKEMPKIYWRSQVVGERSLWHDKGSGRLFGVSDKLLEQLEAEKISGFSSIQAHYS